MDTSNKKFKVYLALAVALILCLIFLSAVVYYLPNYNGIDNTEVEKRPSVEVLASSTTTSYGSFSDHSRYKFTDKDKIEKFRDSEDDNVTDVTEIEVDAKSDHGTQTNPYVIDNFDGWTKFVNDMANNSDSAYTYGEGKYYVLAVDLDFNSSGAPNEEPIYKFGGTFYGLGHTISNWKYTDITNEEATGLIRYTIDGINSQVTITDLNMDSYELNEATSNAGAILGWAMSRNTWILNCHTKGSISRMTARGIWIYGGGIIGGIKWSETNTGQYALDATVYRCSADIDFNAKDNTITSKNSSVGMGGIVGYSNQGCNLNVYDCYANAVHTFTMNTEVKGLFSGGIVGFASIGAYQGLGGVVRLSGCVSKILDYSVGVPKTYWYPGSLIGFYENPDANATTTSYIENIYVSGTVYGAGAGTYKLWPWMVRRSSGGSTSNGRGILSSSGDIYYTGEDSNAGIWNITTIGRYQGNMASGSATNTLIGTAKDNGDSLLWETAKNSTALKSNIWTQKEYIGDTYSIQNSPVINKFDTKTFTVTYKDVRADGNDVTIDTFTYNYPSALSLLQQANKANKVFMGYSFDRTKMEDPVKTLSGSNFYGNLDLYTVWGVMDSDVSKNIAVSGGTEENGTIEVDYGQVITLSADISCSSMGSDAKIDYEWRNNSQSQVVSTSKDFILSNVADSGTYTLYYKLHSASEPLWGFDSWRSAGTKTVKINGIDPRFNPDNFAVTSTAFVGMPMGDLQVFAEFLDETGTPFVGGTITWNGGANAKIDKESLIERDGKLYYPTKMTYTPDATQNSAYANYSSATVDVEFEVVYPKFVFNMDGITTPITVIALYGQRYTKADIASQFEKEFLKNLTQGADAAYNKVKSMEPYFDGVSISDYRQDNSDVSVEGDVNISVTFNDKEYTVQFIYKDENGKSNTHTEQRKYGDNLTLSWLTVPFGYVVNPWRFTDSEGNQRTWRFAPDGDDPVDLVTGALTLESEFRELKLTLDSLEITPRGSYPALTKLDESNLPVIAHYLTDDNEPYVINLGSGNGINNSYKVAVTDSPDGLLHVNNNKIVVTHTYNGKTVTEEITLNVTPIEVDTSNCGFETNVRIKYGDPITLPTVKRIPDGVKSQPTYRYFRGNTEIFDKADIVGDPDRSVTYTIRAIFDTEDDYVAEDLIAQLVISPVLNEEIEKPRFVAGSMTYNGCEQTVILEGFDSNIMTMSLTSSAKDADTYTVRVTLTDSAYKFADGSDSVDIDWTIDKATLSIIWDKFSFEYDGSAKQPKIKQLDGLVNGERVDITTEFAYIGDLDKTEVNTYSVTAVATEFSTWTANYKLSGEKRSYIILPAGVTNAVLVTVEWENTTFTFNDTVQHPTAVVKDMSGNVLTDVKLTFNEVYHTSKYVGEYTCTVSAEMPYFILEGGECKYTITLDGNGNGAQPQQPGENGDQDFDKVKEFVQKWWQVIASAVSIVVIVLCLSKGIGYANKKKENKRTIEGKYSTFYAVTGTGLFGLSMKNWTIIACIMLGVAALSFVFMLLEKREFKKSQRELEDAKEEYERNQRDMENKRRDEDMKMMFMHMMGGNANMNGNMGQGQGGYVYAQQGIGAEEIRGIISETVTALLPGMQQMLPQQASTNDELMQKLIEQNAHNEEVIEKLMNKISEQPPVQIVEREAAASKETDEIIKKLVDGQDMLMKKMSEQPVERLIEREVATASVDDETIKQMMRNQEKLMEKILELSANQSAEKQIVEVPVEKIVEKIVEVPVEKIVEKEVKVEVPVEVEKIVEKEVVKEVKVEVPIEVEKVVEKIVEIPTQKPASKAKVVAPRLTLDEAYEKLSAKQKKFFDTLKAYAMSKDKCKEKKSTYYILLGQSSVNPLVKLTIKKDTTVALFKMEDEFMKDIRRNATNDGTKVKVKETELIVGDAQALATAKEMVDLREDQIERYNDYLKEQRSMKRS
ncbi:MAG: hypothetical protein K2O95_01420 [Clostridia bacterium]|nr:hypothetical protein [Clostridia bacterium]